MSLSKKIKTKLREIITKFQSHLRQETFEAFKRNLIIKKLRF